MAAARTKLVSRERGNRDARIILIATEGEKTERLYLDALRDNRIIDRFRVVLEVIPTPKGTGKSAPEYVLARLEEAQKKHQLAAFDECWLVIDVDRWRDQKLAEVTRRAKQKHYGLAVSNPFFEVWLLLHFADSAPPKKGDIERELSDLCPGISKTHIPAEPFTLEAVEAAIERGQKGDSSSDLWPQSPGTTHVHRLLTSILQTGRGMRLQS